jgi:hypothetical protein
MMKVGDIVQSTYRFKGRDGDLGVVLSIKEIPANSHRKSGVLARVFYPKTQKTGWVNSVDMRVISASR